jgi:SAM-dependent methyltransferase
LRLEANRLENESIYADGTYSSLTGGTWHLEDSPLKAQWIMRMLAKHPEFQPKTVCEIGCGAGGILAELQKAMPKENEFTGYEISPQAHQLNQRFANEKCNFVLGSAFEDPQTFDLALVMDVIEHVEDCFAFMRQVRVKARKKIFHIPLDAHVSAILRGRNSWDDVGHIHLFTKETALKSLEHAGHKICDWTLTDGALSAPDPGFRTRMANLLRRPVNALSPLLSARLLGGNSMLAFTE